MGTATSVVECANRYPWLGDINCTTNAVAYGEFGADPSITGIGTDISFVLTAGLSLLTCSLVQLLCDRLGHHSLRTLLEPLVISFGDQQILRGLSLSIITLYTSSTCTVDAYRYNILCYLLMMAVVSHLSSVLVLRSYVNGQILLSCIRFSLVFAQIFFIGIIFSSRVTVSFPTSIPSAREIAAHNTTLVLPAVCFENNHTKPYTALSRVPKPQNRNSAALTMYVMLFIFYGINIIITIAHVITFFFFKKSSWQMRSRSEQERDRAMKAGTWHWWLGLMRGCVLLGAWGIWIWATYMMWELRAWMNGSGWMGQLKGGGDAEWTFGQLLSVLLLAAAPMSLANAWSAFAERKDPNAHPRHQQHGDHDRLLGTMSPTSPRNSRFSSSTSVNPRRTSDLYSTPPRYSVVEMQPQQYRPFVINADLGERR